MATRMLIDARHPEETRVAVLKGNRIEEFDFESADRKQIKGNIYLAKVTRVEPSLQAAFVDFGGNRHGFLAFSEIHPDYYQIPKEDREALLAEEAAHAEEEAALRAAEESEDDVAVDAEEEDSADEDSDEGGLTEVDTSEKAKVSTIEGGQVDSDDDEDGSNADDDENEEDSAEDEAEAKDAEASDDTGDDEDREDRRPRRRGGRRRQGRGRSKAADDLRARRMELRRRYKIQDVIHRRQVLLVQVVKEERGNKGAALTTYLSLAGRYCVLMPNSSHGGGISRKISSASDRKRLKGIISELNLPKSMGCIVRTAGLSRTKTEIKRDFDYLARLWDELRETTLQSSAPALIHSDSDLIKRAIRDIYNREIEEVVVEGEDGYKAAKSFMKLLMPSHARRVKSYNDPVPLFQRYGAEDQHSAMYDPEVQLKSGGYIVINPTEALVSIDINSGRSTKEHGIEATAVSTNIEAAREIARQLRLRDMAGLVVIDFIDMEYNSNVRKVEKAMKDALKNDRARIQVGRISSFGLMEMSRQRLRTGVLEATTRDCPHCDGTGLVRTASSAGLSALRLIEDEAAKGKGSTISLYASTEAAVYLLNAKRSDLADIEARYGVSVEVVPEGEDEGAKMRVASSGPRNENMPEFVPIVDEDDDDDDEAAFADEDDGDEDGGSRRKRRRRRGGRGRNRDREQREATDRSDDEDAEADDDTASADDARSDDEEGAPKKRRRRGGRRRRGRGRGNDTDASNESGEDVSETAEEADAPAPADEEPVSETADPAANDDTPEAETETAPKRRSSRRKKSEPAAEDKAEETAEETAETTDEAAPADKPKRSRRKKAADDETVTEEPAEKPKRTRRKKAAETAGDEAESAEKPKRTRRKKAPDPEPASETAGDDDPGNDKADQAAAEPVAVEPAQTEPVGESEPETAEASQGAPRRGWWQRTFGD